MNYKVNTFSVIVGNQNITKKVYSKVAKYKSNHKEIIVDERISNLIINEAIKCLDEPSLSVVPSYYISKLISKNYKVAISGDGGDELLGGYYRLKPPKEKKYLDNWLVIYIKSIHLF